MYLCRLEFCIVLECDNKPKFKSLFSNARSKEKEGEKPCQVDNK